MSLFDNLKTDNSIEEDKDSLGGGYVPLESGIYDFTIEIPYIDYSKGGAMSLVLHLKGADGVSHRETFWMTSGKAKGCKNYYENKEGKKKYLPGFTSANNICLLAVGKEISELEPEEKVINIYNPDLKKEAPTKRQVLTDLVGESITLGLLQTIVDKNVKDAQGNYVPSGETRTVVETSSVFRTSDHKTVTEIKAQVEEASFYDQWSEKYTDQVINKAKGAEGSTPNTAPAKTEEKKSLFG